MTDKEVIIDFKKNGNVVRFFLGRYDEKLGWTVCTYRDHALKKSETYYGDDWNDTPYEHNAGQVYFEFISSYVDVAFNFDTIVVEPCEGVINSEYCKDDMRERKVPCLAILSKKDYDPFSYDAIEYPGEFSHVMTHEKSQKIYFGDSVKDIIEKLRDDILGYSFGKQKILDFVYEKDTFE